MEDSKSDAQNEDEEEFPDAIDEFPFYDCLDSFPDEDADASTSTSVPEHFPWSESKSRSPGSLRRRLSFNRRNGSESESFELPSPSSSVSFENHLSSRDGKLIFSARVEGNEEKKEDKVTVELKRSSELENVDTCLDEENKEISTVTDANDGGDEDLVRDDLTADETLDAHSSLLLNLADLVIKAIGFQINLFLSFVTFPAWLLYYSCMFVMDPFGFVRRCREYIIGIIMRIRGFICENLTPFVYEWFKEHESAWHLGLKCVWGLLWSGYVCVVLVGLLVSAFVTGGLIARKVVEEPIRMKESLNFDYTEKSPVAYVPLLASPEVSGHVYLGMKPDFGKFDGSRVIPPNHRLQIVVSLTLPESEYNQKLGIFQVRVDFLTTDGETLASSRRPCMLHYRSLPVRLFLTCLKFVPIVTGYTSEAQNLNIKFRGFTEGDRPTACLKLTIEQRAEFMPGAGIPEIYTASLTLESELPMVKKFVWYWRKTLFVWISIVIFLTELLFALVCCKPIIIPRIRLNGCSATGGERRTRGQHQTGS